MVAAIIKQCSDNLSEVRMLPFTPQVRTLVDVPGEKLPSAATGALQDYMRTIIAPQACRSKSTLASPVLPHATWAGRHIAQTPLQRAGL